MRTSDVGVELIKKFEGCKLEGYLDVAGIPTIGYGHTGKDVFVGKKISQEEADSLLTKDLEKFENHLNEWMFENKVGLNQNQFDALVSFAFNVGFGGFISSTAARRIIDGNYEGAADALLWWNKATIKGVKKEVLGLTRRRIAEAKLFLK